jgi:hypothetical protein
MKRREDRVREWCRSLGITLVAVLIVAAILGTILYGTPNPNAQNGLAIKSGEGPALNSERVGGGGPAKLAPLAQHRKDSVRRGANKKKNEDKTPKLSSGASGVDSEPAMENGFAADAPAQTPAGSTTVADGKVRGIVPTAGPAERKKAQARWVKVLVPLHKGLHAQGSATTKRQAREKAEAALEAIDDPMAVPAILYVFAGKHNHDHLMARMLARIQSADGTKILAYLSVFSPDEKARRLATNALRTRDPIEFVEPLISLFSSPMTCRRGSIDTDRGRAQVLFIEGERADYRFVYPPPDRPGSPPGSKGVYTLDNPYMTPEQRQRADAINQAQAATARAATEAQLKADIEAVNSLNQQIDDLKRRAVEALREATGKSFMPPDREEWRRWLAERQGYAYAPPLNTPKPIIAQVVPQAYSPTFIAIPAPT